MRVFWESIGVLGPIYRMSGHGLSTPEMATALHVPEQTVESCIAWLLRFLEMNDRAELVSYAASTASAIPRDRPVLGYVA